MRYLPLLLTGRRYGTEAEPTKSAHSFYVVFSPAEVAELKQEVVAAVQASIPWRQQWAKSATEKYLLVPLTEVIWVPRKDSPKGLPRRTLGPSSPALG